jgi:hypothetical protein
MRARIASLTRWAYTDDRAQATSAARLAFASKFEQQVDPDGTLDPAERARRAASLKKAHYTRLALLSAQSRRSRVSR